MIYLHTDDNILALLQTVGSLEKAQLKRFFSDELQPIRVDYLLNQLVLKHQLTFNENTGIYSAIGARAVNPEVRERALLAFWVVANMGSNGVSQILTNYYPSQYVIVAQDFSTYDITVVESETEARTAARVLAATILRGMQDDITHIAVLRRPSDVQRLRSVLIECGFDCCVTIDPSSKKPTYTSFDSP